MEHYLLEVAHLFGDRRVHELTYIESPSRQMVKYWYHKHFKPFGFNPGWATSKHTLDIGDGQVVEIEAIEKFDDRKRGEVASEILTHFPKES